MLKRPLAEINVVPYIDVMLVLLVIFMITTPLLTQGININLPKANVKMLSSHELPIIVSIDNRGDYFLNISKKPNQSISLKNLVSEVTTALQPIKQNHQQQGVYIKGDRKVSYGKVIKIMALFQQAGVENISLVTYENNKNNSHNSSLTY